VQKRNWSQGGRLGRRKEEHALGKKIDMGERGKKETLPECFALIPRPILLGGGKKGTVICAKKMGSSLREGTGEKEKANRKPWRLVKSKGS